MSLCNEVTNFSERVYHYLSRVFSYRLRLAEVGITDIFIFEVADYCNNHGLINVKMYGTTWKIETKYGNDIDLFIQRADGKYNRFALQAKSMFYNGAYRDLKLRRAPNQWDKLLDHEADFNSKSFYLFYNGTPNFRPIRTAPTRTDCIGTPTIQQLGLGIVETRIVKRIRETVLTPHGQAYMRHFFPDHMDSIRKLFCCEGGGYSDLKGYDYKDIYRGAPYKLIQISQQELDRDEEIISEQEEEVYLKEHPDIAPLRLIIDNKAEN
ncbi:MAG: hypothetical protein POELPBGB_00804 [Bacteroidia bacterium]|nr:hypothetical protein [Bacteroidia bacterium]